MNQTRKQLSLLDAIDDVYEEKKDYEKNAATAVIDRLRNTRRTLRLKEVKSYSKKLGVEKAIYILGNWQHICDCSGRMPPTFRHIDAIHPLSKLRLADPPPSQIIWCLILWSVADIELKDEYRRLKNWIKSERKYLGSNRKNLSRHVAHTVDWAAKLSRIWIDPPDSDGLISLFKNRWNTVYEAVSTAVAEEEASIQALLDGNFPSPEFCAAFGEKNLTRVYLPWALSMLRDVLSYAGDEPFNIAEIEELYTHLGVELDLTEILSETSEVDKNPSIIAPEQYLRLFKRIGIFLRKPNP